MRSAPSSFSPQVPLPGLPGSFPGVYPVAAPAYGHYQAPYPYGHPYDPHEGETYFEDWLQDSLDVVAGGLQATMEHAGQLIDVGLDDTPYSGLPYGYNAPSYREPGPPPYIYPGRPMEAGFTHGFPAPPTDQQLVRSLSALQTAVMELQQEQRALASKLGREQAYPKTWPSEDLRQREGFRAPPGNSRSYPSEGYNPRGTYVTRQREGAVCC